MNQTVFKTSDKARLRFKEHYRKNKEKYRAYSDAWWKSHPDELRAKWRRRAKSPNGRAKAKRYRQKYLERIRLGRRMWQKKMWVHRQDYMRKYYQRNKEKIKTRVTKRWAADKTISINANQIRRARKAKAPVDDRGISTWVRSVKQKLTFTCYYCSLQFLVNEVHFDHVIPLAKEGRHSIGNLCTACSDCNLSKNDSLPSRWLKHPQLFLDL